MGYCKFRFVLIFIIECLHISLKKSVMKQILHRSLDPSKKTASYFHIYPPVYICLSNIIDLPKYFHSNISQRFVVGMLFEH